jgi:hypothetical protein
MKYYITLLCLTLFSVHTLSAQVKSVKSVKTVRKATKNPFSWERPQGMSLVEAFPTFTTKWVMPSKNVFQNQVSIGALSFPNDTAALIGTVGKRYNFFEYKKLKLYVDANAGYSCLTHMIPQYDNNNISSNSVNSRSATATQTPRSTGKVSDGASTRHTLIFYETIGLQYVLFGKKQEENMPISGLSLILEYHKAQFFMLKDALRFYGSFQAGFGLHF